MKRYTREILLNERNNFLDKPVDYEEILSLCCKGCNIKKYYLRNGIIPLKKSLNRWKPSLSIDWQEKFIKNINGNLNKLTKDNFDNIVLQLTQNIVDDTNIQLEQLNVMDEKAKQSLFSEALNILIDLIFEKAIYDKEYHELYAKLCLRLSHSDSSNKLSLKLSDTTFSELFLNKILKKAELLFNEILNVKYTKNVSDTDDIYIYNKSIIKQKSCGYISYLGELYLNGIVNETIIHYCIQNILRSELNEAHIDILIELFNVIGNKIENKKSKEYIDIYFDNIKRISENKSLMARIRYILMDLIELRSNGWSDKQKWR